MVYSNELKLVVVGTETDTDTETETKWNEKKEETKICNEDIFIDAKNFIISFTNRTSIKFDFSDLVSNHIWNIFSFKFIFFYRSQPINMNI